jgi:hypothetical protein
MKRRSVVIHTGKKFRVPEHIVRLDSESTHGWQVRYGDSTENSMFSDGSPDGRGAGAALERATEELVRRIKKMPAPTGLKRAPSAGKASKLPVGISGPIERLRANRNVKHLYFGVTIPRFGQRPRNASVYISTENTYNKKKYSAALAKAVELRGAAEREYRSMATKAKRAAHR